jgi:predicted transcriptional regulator
MPPTPQDVTETELAVLQVLWDRGTATRPQITEAVYPGGGPSQYATVQKLLERLEAKGFVQHTRTGSLLQFTATLGREDLIGRRLHDLAEKLCGGSLTPLLLNLVRSRPLSDAELDELRAVIDDQRPAGKRRGKPR